MLNHSRWKILPAAPAAYLKGITGFPPLVAQIFYNRGLATPAQIASFIATDEQLCADPMRLPGMHQAIGRIYRALLSGENIAVYGDFDADGITATALVVQGLSSLDAKVTPYLPHRVNEGHGLRTGTLEKLREQGVSLVVTVDCGITGVAEVKKARRLGLDIVITDHHTPLEEIPQAAAVVDPKLAGSDYPFTELAGVGVAFKLIEALFQSLGKELPRERLLDLVALGTVADVMPLQSENRYLVKEGLKLLNASPRLGIREMITQAGLTPGKLDSEAISWVLAPRLNTTGRLEHALPSYQLLMTDSTEEARRLSQWLEQKNAERQRLTISVVADAREKITAEGIKPILIAGDEDYPAGLVGLAAGRLTDEFYRPSVVIKLGKQQSTGSCRSIPEFNILSALNRCHHLFSRFGGHAQAAGFSIPTKKLPILKQSLLETATKELAGVDLRPHLDIDAEVRLAELGGNSFPAIQKLAPFGQGNPNPAFLSRGVEVADCRTMGSGGEHLRLKLRQDGVVWDGVAFQAGDYRKEAVSPLDIVYNLEVDHWGGESKLRLNLLDFRASE
ncbi:MAG: single-stranded-DNA-specific exonuclease RecJ [Dehalococcoidales bacterium]|nr:single-stranded-DNA-specific exonuclease RecJ [Dehalococcoidales bacterium]